MVVIVITMLWIQGYCEGPYWDIFDRVGLSTWFSLPVCTIWLTWITHNSVDEHLDKIWQKNHYLQNTNSSKLPRCMCIGIGAYDLKTIFPVSCLALELTHIAPTISTTARPMSERVSRYLSAFSKAASAFDSIWAGIYFCICTCLRVPRGKSGKPIGQLARCW